jgi:hypothetical protein
LRITAWLRHGNAVSPGATSATAPPSGSISTEARPAPEAGHCPAAAAMAWAAAEVIGPITSEPATKPRAGLVEPPPAR